jgi:hypothetical protein
MFFVLIKVVGWQWINRYSMLREIKRLELRIAALTESLHSGCLTNRSD